MKKLLLSLSLILSVAIGAKAQTIVNGSFENWTSTQVDELSAWSNSNRESMRDGVITVTKVAGVTGSAVKLETSISAMGDTLGAFIANTPGDPISGEGGVPFSQTPTAFTGKYKANMVGNDSAVLLVNFKKNGVSIGLNTFTLGGKNQTTFTTFNFPISLTGTPDTVIIASASSNLLSNMGVAIGSNIIYDDFAFTGPGVTQTIPNGNFDSWTILTLNKINGWEAEGLIEKTSDSYKGTAAIKLSSMLVDNRVENAYLTNGQFPSQSGSMIGRPFTNQNDTLIGYYKFSAPGPDSAVISIQTTKAGNTVGGAYISLTAKATYTEFRIPISSMDVPDSMVIFISPSSLSSQPVPGCILILDEVQLASAPLNTGLLTSNPKTKTFNIYPNPAVTTLFITDVETGADVSIYDIAGKLMLKQTKTGTNHNMSIDLNSLDAGMYQCIIVTKTGASSQQKFLKQ